MKISLWLLESLGRLRTAHPRVIVYCQNIMDVSQLYEMIAVSFGPSAYEGDHHIDNKLLGKFHTFSTKEDIKAAVLSGVVFATNALGMCVNFKDVEFIVQYGPPRNLDEYQQHIGRAGQSGQQSVAVVISSWQTIDYTKRKRSCSQY